MKKPILALALVLVFAVACTTSASKNADVQTLRGDVALDGPSAEPPALEWKEGGPSLQKSFAQQPPMVPHSVDDYAITMESNDCMGCHGNAEATGATALPGSHFRDRDGNMTETLAARRFFCTQCHAPQKLTTPIIGNDFTP